ncbi:neprilysin-3-like isoform X1 [Neodiprion virginianus]|uniref:neprilysin-3-like isoform X1 n=1 Tax=Neodiprion virginianus TaxID=2961670 RepID=UPI001EE74154|nr:neprilysin-3-like isoform X1 [Neodiprion virginianus]XP_046614384.1 neprilysin-3-like isoform X1 [Neodiprion virginianus]
MVHVERPAQPGTWVCCVPCYWLRRSKAVHKALLTLAMLLVTSLLVTSPVLFLITTLPEAEQPRECSPQDEVCLRDREGQEGVCESSACEEASKRMLASVKRGVDPCRDFYQFACGGFSRNNRDNRQTMASFNTLQSHVDNQIKDILANTSGRMNGAFYKLGEFYKSCVDFKKRPANFSPMYQLLDELGGYMPPRRMAPSDITPLVASLLRVNGAPLFDVYVDVEPYDHTRRAVFLDLPTKSEVNTFYERQKWLQDNFLPSDELKMQGNNVVESKAYTFIKQRSLQLRVEEQRLLQMEKILQGFLPKNMGAKERENETNQILLFCSMLNKIYPRHKDLYNWMDQRGFLAHNLTSLQENFGYIRWGTLFGEVLGADRNHDQELLGPEDQVIYVYVTAPHYFRSLGKLLNRFSRRIIHNGLLLLYARDTLHDVVNVSASKNWNASCSKLSTAVFSSAVGALYVQQYSQQHLNSVADKVTRLFDRIKSTLAERMLVMSWLDEETRTQALLKLRALEGKFHVWPGFQNNTRIAMEMTEVVVDPHDFFSNVVTRFRQIRAVKGDALRGNITSKWPHPFVVNAYYDSTVNAIVIPTAMLTAWPWDVGPSYMSHATLGVVIGHEVLHAFDVHHRSHHPEEWLWLTTESRRRLEARIECVAKLYAGSFWKKVQFLGNSVDVQLRRRLLDPRFQFDWNVTRNENMADIGALQISYQAWQTLTNGKDRTLPGLQALRPSQLFFIAAAQPYCSNVTAEDYIMSVELDDHTPHPERVNGIVMNSQAFAEAFRCPAGSKMNPQRKCSTW